MVLVGRVPESAEEIRRLRVFDSDGATIIAWQHRKIVQDRFVTDDVGRALERNSVRFETPARLLSTEAKSETEVDFEVEDAVISWFKSYGRDYFRERFRHDPLSLWWWSELYLYHETPLRLVIRDIEMLARLVEVRQPRRLVVLGPVRELDAAARHLVPRVQVIGELLPSPPSHVQTTRLHVSDLLKMIGTGLKSVFRRRPRPSDGSPRVFFLTHGSMWRGDREMYFDRILPAIEALASTSVVAFGPPSPFKQRGFVDSAKDMLEVGASNLPYVSSRRYFSAGMCWTLIGAFSESRRMWRTFAKEATPTHRGVELGATARASFRDTFYRQHPWALRSYYEVRSALVSEKPDVLVLYAESSGLGRAAVSAARELGIPSFAIQHGIMYPHYYSHEHAPFELEGEAEGRAVPIPTTTAVYGSVARDLLVDRGSYDPGRIVITGSPKFDELVKAAEGYDAEATRASLGLAASSRFVVLASRWSAIGPVFRELVDAVEQLDDVWLLVKPHQAEATAPYEDVLHEVTPTRSRLLPASSHLLELLFASDGLVTVDSFASSEALVLGRRVLVVNLPSNLDALVDKGVAVGVRRGDSILAGLERLLFDEDAARAVEEKRRDYIQEFASGADGRSTERIVAAILETAQPSKDEGK